MLRTKTREVMFHVGTQVVCQRLGCYLQERPRTFSGSGPEGEDAEDFADAHERNSKHAVRVLSLCSRRPVKG
jgi:hypothetical protein